MAPKTPENDPGIEIYRVLKDLKPIWDRFLHDFLKMFNMFLYNIQCIFEQMLPREVQSYIAFVHANQIYKNISFYS